MVSTRQDCRTRTLRALEWDRLRSLLADEAHTDKCRELCLALMPSSGLSVCQILLDETKEAASLIEVRSGFNFESLPNLDETIHRLKAKASLSGLELAGVKHTLTATRLTRSSLSLLDKQSFPQLTKFISELFSLDKLTKEIEAAIEDDGEVKSTASPLLNQLRSQVHQLDNQIRDELTKIIHKNASSKVLQEPIFTKRNDRYVLPIVASMRGSIEGIVHDSSASGLTVYVEPISVVEMENKLRLKQAEIEREIARILSLLSTICHDHHNEIEVSFNTLIQLDFIMTRARLGKKYDGHCPPLTKEGKLKFIAARHPLMVLREKAQDTHPTIPNDIILSTDDRSFIITGPNTGGKTVYLKTAGLLCLMIRSGLMLPVKSGSEALYFNDVFADIGDEQSIEQNLSTFSSHMTNIVEIIEQVQAGDLVLLDEIGAGTDPKEGAALARAILEKLNNSFAYTIASTHYGELKTLAYATKGFVNASLKFDEANLAPTYHLQIGIPGSSKATTMARRLGLNANVVEAAEEFLLASDADLQKTIEQLEGKLKHLAELEEEAKQASEKASRQELEAFKQLEAIEKEKEKLKTSYSRQLEDDLGQAQEMVRQLIKDLQSKPSSQKAQQAQKEIEQIRQALNWTDKTAEKNQPGEVKVGQKVKVLSLNQVGTVMEAPKSFEAESSVTVKIGNFPVKVSLAELVIVDHSTVGKDVRPPKIKYQSPASTASSSQVNVFVQTAGNTLDLRGHRVLEAMDELEKFLDHATVANLSPVMIIHGHGTGAVKSAVREYLRTSSYVDSSRPGESYEGGDGVTVVELI